MRKKLINNTLRIVGRGVGLGLLMLFLHACGGGACREPLVDDSYGTVDTESINGLDAFYELLAVKNGDEKHELERSSYLTHRIRREADVVVFFESNHIYGEDYYRRLEGWLYGLSTAEIEELEQVVPDEEDFESIEGVWNAQRRLALQGEEDREPDEANEGNEGDKYKTILYFLKDTDASIAFWEYVAGQVRESPDHVAYCESMIGRERFARNFNKPPVYAPFATRSEKYPGGAPQANLLRDRSVFRSAIPRYPVRTVPGAARSLFGLDGWDGVPARTLLATSDGDDIIRQVELPNARLIVVFNSEPFLNFSLVRPEYRRMARDLIRHALNQVPAGQEPNIAIVRRQLLPSADAAENEFDFLRFLFVFPINLIVLHFLLILVLFLLSRWPHWRPPLETAPAGNREFLEHIRALGVRLSRTRPRLKALGPLLQYKQKTTGKDYSEVIRRLEGQTARKADAPPGNASNHTNDALESRKEY